ncbi:MAG: Cytochrome c oxidase polypeptide [Myxococcaceae bacterium]|nr:Cytochrome c oxidase polypeptide [Myxococcaceae bacterium]
MTMQAEHEHNELHGHHGLPYLAHHFDTPVQQFDAAKLGMWLFLAQEVLFFSGLFVAYLVFRLWYPDAWSVCSHELDWKMGTVNTLVLLFSSLTAVLAVRSAQLGERAKVNVYILITIACAFAFLVIKYFEYVHKFEAGLLPGSHFAPVAGHTHATVFPPGSAAYFSVYFMATGVHGLHVIIGIGVLFWILKRNMSGEFSKDFFTPVDLVALYWHLVDLIWIYLFPFLYLID